MPEERFTSPDVPSAPGVDLVLEATVTAPGRHRPKPMVDETISARDDRDARATAPDRAKASTSQTSVVEGHAERSTPQTIGHFVVLSVLGEGAMGVVYSCFDEELERRVAIKVLNTRKAVHETARTRMLREARALARISHPNVVPVYEVGEHQGEIFIAMEYIKGQTLSEWLAPGAGEPRSWISVVQTFIEVGRGLAEAHHRGIVHRDFKPDNVLIGADGRPRVVDFGLARDEGADPTIASTLVRVIASNSDKINITADGVLLGTPAYMSPEQLLTYPADAISDQFSFCVALWEGIYGERPFRAGTLEKIRQKVTGGLIDPITRSISVPVRLDKALRRGLAAEPKERFESMDELLVDLVSVVDAAGGRRRLLWPSLALAGLLAGTGAWTWALSRDPTAAVQSELERHAQGAQRAGSQAMWVYPRSGDPENTSYRWVRKLEALDDAPPRAVEETAGRLRANFAEALVALGDRYHDRPGAEPYAREFYLQALFFEPENAHARSRVPVTRLELKQWADAAALGEFSDTELLTAELLAILADKADAPEVELVAALTSYYEAQEVGTLRADRQIRELIGLGTDRLLNRDELVAFRARIQTLGDAKAPSHEMDPEGEPSHLGASAEPPREATTSKRSAKGKTPIGDLDKPLPPKPAESSPVDNETGDLLLSDHLTQQGDQHFSSGKSRDASKSYYAALDQNIRNHRAFFGLCKVAFDNRDCTEAIQKCKKATNIRPSSGKYHFRLARAYECADQHAKGREHYERALKLGDHRAQKNLDRLNGDQ